MFYHYFEGTFDMTEHTNTLVALAFILRPDEKRYIMKVEEVGLSVQATITFKIRKCYSIQRLWLLSKMYSVLN